MSHISEYEDKSIMLILFEDIQAAILAKDINGNSLTPVSEVVVYSEQQANEDTERPYCYPYVSSEINIEWDFPEAIGSGGVYGDPPVAGQVGNQKKGIATVTLHVMFANRDDSTDVFLTNEPIKHLVHRQVDGLDNDPFFTPLLKTAENLPVIDTASQDHTIVYICAVKEGAYVKGVIGTVDEIGIDGTLGETNRPELEIP